MEHIYNIINGIPRKNVTISDQRQYLIDKLGSHHIKIIYNQYDGRTILSIFKRNGPFDAVTVPYIGYILDLNNGNNVVRNGKDYPVIEDAPVPLVLGIVPMPVTDQYVFHEIANGDNIRVIPINDGTTITMYWFQNRWVYSTIISYDYGSMSWSDDITNGDIIDDAFTECKFDVSALNKTKCYTVGFKGSTHQFLEGTSKPVYKMWFIRSVDVSSLNKWIQTKYSPDNETVFSSFESTSDDIGIPLQSESKLSLDSILKSNAIAYDTFIKTGVVDYGYIVYNNNIPYLMESDLYRHIRYIFYDCPVPGSHRDRRRGNNSDINMYPIDRQKFCILHAVLSSRHSAIFLKLFPQFAAEVDYIKDQLLTMHKSLVTEYKSYMGLSDAPATSISGNKLMYINFKYTIQVDKKYKAIWDIMIKKLPLTRLVDMVPEMVSAFLITENNAQTIYPILYGDY